MEDYKQYLNDHDDPAERRAAEQVMDGLTGLRLEAKVEAVAAERAALLRRRFWRRVVLGAVLVLVAGAALLYGLKKQNPPAPTPPPQKQEPIAHEDQVPGAPTTPPDDAREKKKQGPIAQVQPSGPRYPAPEVTMIRGDETANKALQALLDQVWYTHYPLTGLTPAGDFAEAGQRLEARDFTAAYVLLQRLERAQPANDTLRYLKGYCLLEMGEGDEALRYFENLENQQPAWRAQLEWYRGLGLLLAGEKEQALAAFKKMAAQPKHPYRIQSQRAHKALK
jgi:tetratricopeptide (TPR) repeat protein